MKPKVILFYFILLASTKSLSQDLTHEGTDFWLGFTEVYDAAKSKFYLHISSTEKTSGVISIFAGKGVRTPFNLTPGKILSVELPNLVGKNNISEEVLKKSIHVHANHPITVQASIERYWSSEQALCLPTSSFGSEYMVVSYKNYEEHYTGFSESQFVVVCGDYPTTLEITPACQTKGGKPAKEPFLIALNPGEMYPVKAFENNRGDLTGSIVRAIDDTSKFIVYQGHKFTKMANKKCEGGTSGDPLFEVALPTSVWGNNFILTRPDVQYMNLYRVVSLQDSCDIYNGKKYLTTINKGEYYTGDMNDLCMMIRTTKPATVAQYLVSASGKCNPEKIGDPAMSIVSSVEQMYLKHTTFAVTEQFEKNYLTVVTRTADINSITLDGTTINGFTAVPGYPDFSYTFQKLSKGTHEITTTGKGFNTSVCGIIEAESAFLPAGLYVGKKIEIFERNFPFFSFYFLNDERESFIDRMDSMYYKNTKEIAELMFFNDDLSMNISGFTSTPGDSLYNDQLAWDRADVVKAKIMEQYQRLCAAHGRPFDFNPTRLQVASYGELPEYLIEPNDNDEENDDEIMREAKQAKNRRVEVVFVLDK